jgi:hypothetical protein
MALKTISLVLLVTLNAEAVDSNEAAKAMSKFVQVPAARMTRPAIPVDNGATFATASDAILESVADLEKQSQEMKAEYQGLRARIEKLSQADVNASIAAPSSSRWFAAFIASFGLAATMGLAAVKKYMGQGQQGSESATAFQIRPIVAMAQTDQINNPMAAFRPAIPAGASRTEEPVMQLKFNFGKKKAPAPKKEVRRAADNPSIALPFTTTNLDGSLVGDVGFDPLGFSKYAPGAWWQGDEGDGSLKIFREAELMHGRIAQLACLGWVFPEIAHFPGKDGAFGKMNPFEAVDAIPNAGWYQILAFMASLEVYRVNKLKDPAYVPGDLSLGQGPGRWNPFGFDYTPEEYAEKQLQEIKHCRLAMLGIIGLAAKSSGAGDVGVLAMLGGGKPEFVTKAGFYFPEGI